MSAFRGEANIGQPLLTALDIYENTPYCKAEAAAPAE
jgi:hypothetical protein